MQMRKIATMVLATLPPLLLSPTSFGGGSYSDWATVTSVEPVERSYTIRRPVEKCWTETVRVTQPGSSDGNYTNELVGGLLGGVLGNQFGRGRGKDAMTIAGAALGASIANDAERQRAAGQQEGGRYEEVERCETIYQAEEKSEFSHYRVSYDYNGHQFTANMKRDPGETIRIKIQVAPN